MMLTPATADVGAKRRKVKRARLQLSMQQAGMLAMNAMDATMPLTSVEETALTPPLTVLPFEADDAWPAPPVTSAEKRWLDSYLTRQVKKQGGLITQQLGG